MASIAALEQRLRKAQDRAIKVAEAVEKALNEKTELWGFNQAKQIDSLLSKALKTQDELARIQGKHYNQEQRRWED